jgi:xanthine dehydrogenase accessory factor
VSGGCVETAVYGEMGRVLAGGAPRLLRFGITGDMIWDVGLACGGTIDVLVQELDPGLAAALARELEAGRPAGLATVVAGPAGVGQTVLAGEEGLLFGPDDPLLLAALTLRLESRQAAGNVQALDDGREVYLEAFLPPPSLYILGGVHVAIPLARFARELGFRVVVADPREKFANRERFPEADEVLVEWPDEALAHLPVGADTYIVLLTHDPKIDEPALAAALRSAAVYIGAIGSRKTHAERAVRMGKWGVTAADLARVHAPIGLDLGGRTPEETALSIIAEVVAVKNGRGGGPLRGSSGPIGSGG